MHHALSGCMRRRGHIIMIVGGGSKVGGGGGGRVLKCASKFDLKCDLNS